MLQWIIRALMLISVISAVAASLTLDTYTPQTPKRLFLQHMIRVAANGEQESVYAAASSDATPVDVVLKGMNLTPAQQDGREWLVRIFVCQTCLFDVTKLFPAFKRSVKQDCSPLSLLEKYALTARLVTLTGTLVQERKRRTALVSFSFSKAGKCCK